MNQDQPSKKVVIEDLLRIKRAERPPAEFWARFEQELRAKQLAAIVEKRPWWRTLPQFNASRAWARLQVPAGALALLAVTIVSFRHYQVSADVSVLPGSSVTSSSGIGNLGAGSSLVDIVPMGPSQVPEPAQPSDLAAVGAQSSAGFALDRASSSADVNPTPQSDLIASVADQIPTDPKLVSLSNGFESRVLPARTPVTEPLSQLQTPKSVRLRDRYLGGALAAGYSFDSTATAPDRAVHRLQDRQLKLEDLSRFDARGNSLSIKL